MAQLSFNFGISFTAQLQPTEKNVKVAHHFSITANDEDTDWGIEQYEDIVDFEYTTNYSQIFH